MKPTANQMHSKILEIPLNEACETNDCIGVLNSGDVDRIPTKKGHCMQMAVFCSNKLSNSYSNIQAISQYGESYSWKPTANFFLQSQHSKAIILPIIRKWIAKILFVLHSFSHFRRDTWLNLGRKHKNLLGCICLTRLVPNYHYYGCLFFHRRLNLSRSWRYATNSTYKIFVP